MSQANLAALSRRAARAMTVPGSNRSGALPPAWIWASTRAGKLRSSSGASRSAAWWARSSEDKTILLSSFVKVSGSALHARCTGGVESALQAQERKVRDELTDRAQAA